MQAHVQCLWLSFRDERKTELRVLFFNSMHIFLKQHVTFPLLFAYCARKKFEKGKLRESERLQQNLPWNVSKILSVLDSEEFLVDKLIVGCGGGGIEHFE
jgi:hypothetical protein